MGGSSAFHAKDVNIIVHHNDPAWCAEAPHLLDFLASQSPLIAGVHIVPGMQERRGCKSPGPEPSETRTDLRASPSA